MSLYVAKLYPITGFDKSYLSRQIAISRRPFLVRIDFNAIKSDSKFISTIIFVVEIKLVLALLVSVCIVGHLKNLKQFPVDLNSKSLTTLFSFSTSFEQPHKLSVGPVGFLSIYSYSKCLQTKFGNLEQ